MGNRERVQNAIAKAKEGHVLSARDLFLDIVQDEPDNKQAWLWLIGLLEDTDKAINACENVLRLDPSETRVLKRLQELHIAKADELANKVKVLMSEAQRLLDSGEMEYGLIRVREVLTVDPTNEKGWGILAKISPELDEQVLALERLAALDPGDRAKRALFERWAYYQAHPFELAAFYKERGKWDMAIDVYKRMAATVQGNREWSRLVREIDRLEYLQQENIAYVSPLFSIIRMTAGMPILFFFLLIIHTGYDFEYFTLGMGIGFLMVLGGSFLTALAAVGAEHELWRRLGNAAGRASKGLRFVVSTIGFLVMIIPFLLLSWDAFLRWMRDI